MKMLPFSIICCLLFICFYSSAQTLTTSNLPIIKIYTDGDEIPDDPKITATMGIINGESVFNNVNDPFTDYDGPIGIETRGNSTQGFDKKTYSIELRTPTGADSSVALLGMPKEEDWILHAMVIDKSLLRIPMSFYFMQEMGHYAARWRYVELMINDEYRGVYILTERIKRDKNRVDIAKLKTTDISGPERTGGYILRIDWLEDDPQGFESNYNSLAGDPMFYQWYYPKADKIQPEQAAYIENFMDEFEEALWSPTYHNSLGKHYSQYIDLTSFADFIIINELSRNSDGYKLSSYIHKEKVGAGNKFKAGPMWDFDQTYGLSTVCGGHETEGWNYTQEHPDCEDYNTLPQWYNKLMADPLFQNHLKCRWELHRANHLHKDSIYDWIDVHANLLDTPKDRNFTKWDVLGEAIWSEPEPIPTTYAAEISYLKNWISDRIDWLDANIPGDCSADVVGQIEETPSTFNSFPNPTSSSIHITLSYFLEGMTYRLVGLNGQLMESGTILSSDFDLDMSQYARGVYLLEVQSSLGLIRGKIIRS
jgi:hypothetical protein